ncbi:MAG: phage/plasmid primase, P4 family [Xanthomonadales bacterium]|nr:phage/plasmid primase, P4 family [Xanthomonadales bacterium]
MSHEFKERGRALIDLGYLITPTWPDKKSPSPDGWQNLRLDAAGFERMLTSGFTNTRRRDNSTYHVNPSSHGVGVLCGVGPTPVAAVDVDTTDSALAARFADWCEEHLGFAPARVGQAPKTLLLYRAAEPGWRKTTSAWFKDSAGDKHRLEILGDGQQFVAHAVHPGTGQPYEWVDIVGGIEAFRAGDLEVVTLEEVAAAVANFERMAIEAGLEKASGTKSPAPAAALDDDPFVGMEPAVGVDLVRARELLQWADREDYDEWLVSGMALHHEFEGSDDALDVWDEWSSEAANYAGRDDLEFRWRGFGRSGHRSTTMRTLLMWEKDRRAVAQHDASLESRDEIKTLVQECEDSIALLGSIALRVGHLATDRALRAEAEGLVQARFKELTGVRPGIDKVRAAMRPEPVSTGVIPRRQFTEMGNRDRMLDRYGSGLMYVAEMGAWYGWTGSYWRQASETEVKALAQETISHLPQESEDVPASEREAFFKFVAQSQRANMIKAMVDLAGSDRRIMVRAEQLDQDSNLLCCANGEVDLTSGDLLPSTPKHRLTRTTGIKYDETADCPLFKKTFLDVFEGDEAMVSFFQRLVGYTILGSPKEDVLVIPYGTGANGKSTVIGAIRDALGQYARTAGAETFLSDGKAGSNSGGAREDVLRLRGARLVYVSEPDEGSELKEGLVKAMTGGEPMPARGLYQRSTVEVVPTWTAFMPTNHRPIIKGDDHAIWRRLLPIPFTKNFDKDPTVRKDPDRADKLRAELPGILRWCVEGAIAYRREGLNPPAAVKRAREAYRADMDLLSDWLEECCEEGAGLVASNADLWASWEDYARRNGLSAYIRSSRALSRRLATRYEPVKDCEGLRGRGFVGVRVIDVLTL